MAQYTAIFTKPYEDGYENLPSQNTPITAETLNDKDNAIVNIETYLSTNDIPSDAEGLSYDNTDSGLTADNVQGAIDELNDEKVDKTGVDVKTNTTGQFNTITGGLLESCIVNLEPIQSGSGTPSPSNVRPISGHTQVQVRNWGKNKLNYNAWKNVNIQNGTAVFENNGVTLTATANDCYTGYAADFPTDARIPISEGETITISWKETSNKSGLVIIFPNATITGAVYVDNANVKSLSYTATSGVTFVTFRFGVQNSGNTIEYKDIQIERGSSATDYEPYKGYTHVINLGGTYYGGTLDAVSGKLTVTHGFKDLGTLTYTAYPNVSGFYATLSDAPNGATGTSMNAICSQYSVVQTKGSVAETLAQGDSIFALQNGSNIFWIKDTSKASMSASDFKTAMSGVQLAYELATPFTIQLDPTQLETLVGQNDVFAPLTGQSLDSLTYREVMVWDDVERAVAVKLDLSSVAPIEYTDKASQSYNQKQLFIKDNKLCQALASISSGASFTENTNFKYTTLAEIIEPLIP